MEIWNNRGDDVPSSFHGPWLLSCNNDWVESVIYGLTEWTALHAKFEYLIMPWLISHHESASDEQLVACSGNNMQDAYYITGVRDLSPKSGRYRENLLT